jgi:hypothetical protein
MRRTVAGARVFGMKAAIVIAILLVPSVGIGIAVGAGPKHGYTDIRTETSPAIELLPGTTAAVLAQCDPGERAVGGGFAVAGDHAGVAVRSSRRAAIGEQLSGWVVTFANHTREEQFVTSRAVCQDA